MSKSILTEVFGVAEGYELVRTEYEGDFLRLHLDVQDPLLVCPKCASRKVSRKGRRHRELQTPNRADRARQFYTLVIVLDTGRVVWVARGKKGASLKAFWRALRKAKAKIRAVCCDLSAA